VADLEEYAKAQEEGVRFMFLAQPVAVIGNEDGEVTGVRCVRTELTDPDNSGRPGFKMTDEPKFDVPADIVFVAFGFTAPQLPDSDDFARLATNAHGYLQLDENQMTNFPGVFAGGSIARGPAPLVQAVRDARKAVAAMDQYLSRLKSSTV